MMKHSLLELQISATKALYSPIVLLHSSPSAQNTKKTHQHYQTQECFKISVVISLIDVSPMIYEGNAVVISDTQGNIAPSGATNVLP